MGKKIKKIKITKKKLIKHLKKLNMLDNDLFAFLAQNKLFCQEFLRVLLEDNNLIVLENQPQKFISGMFLKNVYLDLLCKLSDGTLVNVEIQLYEDKNHPKRIFTYASKIRVASIEKGKKYKNADNIIIIYLTKEDIFKRGSTVYEVDMNIVSDRGEEVGKWDCGLRVLYINCEGFTNKNIDEYLMLLTNRKIFNEEYKITNSIKKEILEKGGDIMNYNVSNFMKQFIEQCKDEGREEGREEGIARGELNAMVKMIDAGFLTVKDAKEKFGISASKLRKARTAIVASSF